MSLTLKKKGDPIQPVQIRYSSAFKLQIVKEIESGHLSIETARRKYEIGGSCTIQKWINKFGKNQLLAKVVRVESLEERDRIKSLEAKVRELESALAQSQVKILAMESLIEVSEKYTGLDLKKNFGHKRSSTQKKSGKKEQKK
jgi:transposase-like protein